MGSTALYSKMFLRVPDGNNIIDGNADDSGAGGGGGSQQNQNQNNQQNQQSQKPAQKADDDLGLDDIFAGDDNQDDEDSFSLPDEDNMELTEDEKNENEASANNVKTQLQNLIGGFSITEADIPDELGFGDKAKAAEFMTGQFRKGLQSSMQMMLPVINHALTIATKQLDKRINSSVKQTGNQVEAKKAFDALGFTGADQKLAKNFFVEGLKRKLTPQQAATATRNAMKQLGKSGKAPAGPNGRSNGNQMDSGVKTGEAALDSFF
jgi:hypothetical protein